MYIYIYISNTLHTHDVYTYKAAIIFIVNLTLNTRSYPIPDLVIWKLHVNPWPDQV